jgi:hypothetical protein
MRKQPTPNMQKAKVRKALKNEFLKARFSETSIDPDNTSEFGALTLPNLKKNLGCGG